MINEQYSADWVGHQSQLPWQLTSDLLQFNQINEMVSQGVNPTQLAFPRGIQPNAN